LPNHKTDFITSVVERGWLINSTTPNSNHVIVGLKSCLDNIFSVLLSDSWLKKIDWDEVGAFSKDRYPVNFKIEMSTCCFRLA
jgi:hypothetical protein